MHLQYAKQSQFSSEELENTNAGVYDLVGYSAN